MQQHQSQQQREQHEHEYPNVKSWQSPRHGAKAVCFAVVALAVHSDATVVQCLWQELPCSFDGSP